MKWITCPHCGDRVVLTAEGNCPACRRAATAPGQGVDNPYQPPHQHAAADHAPSGLTLGEKIYTAVVILCAGFLLLSLAMFHFFLIPRTDDPGIFYFVVSVVWLVFLALSATTAVNLHARTLLVIPTVVQCAALGCGLYFLPISLWGAVLLYRRIQRDKRISPAAAVRTSPARS